MPMKRRIDKTRNPMVTSAMVAVFDKMRYASMTLGRTPLPTAHDRLLAK